MSRSSTKEYLLRMQEDDLGVWNRRKRGRLLDEARRVMGLERKHVNNSHQKYRDGRILVFMQFALRGWIG